MALCCVLLLMASNGSCSQASALSNGLETCMFVDKVRIWTSQCAILLRHSSFSLIERYHGAGGGCSGCRPSVILI